MTSLAKGSNVDCAQRSPENVCVFGVSSSVGVEIYGSRAFRAKRKYTMKNKEGIGEPMPFLNTKIIEIPFARSAPLWQALIIR